MTGLFCILCSLGCLSFANNANSISLEEYNNTRAELINKDLNFLLGASLTLNDPREVKVNRILMSLKQREFQIGIDSLGTLFPAGQHFFQAKEVIEKSKVFEIIKLLPKGSNLHLHLEPAADINFVIKNITKWNDLFYCLKENNHMVFRFSNTDNLPPCTVSDPKWKVVSDLYKKASSEDVVTQWLESTMSLLAKQRSFLHIDAKDAWIVFESAIATLASIVKYEKALKEVYYKILLDHYNDNVMYVEFRSSLSHVYRLNQSLLSSDEFLQLCKEVTEDFIKDYPDFLGAKVIYAPHRCRTSEEIHKALHEAIILKEKFPTFFAGFDLVGQEDKGDPLTNFLREFIEAAEKGMKFFFHSGETNWYGTNIDENLVDAILLNTTRLGHAFALYRHPLLYEMVKNSSIAVELCPISNEILKHVEDLRTHPSAIYLRDGFPVVVASDDPGMWGALPLSHDWYITFMAIGGQKADLRFLKQLAINSIKYSAMTNEEKDTALKKWEFRWEHFLDKVLEVF